MMIASNIKRAVLLLAFFQALLFTTCDKEQQAGPLKNIQIINVTASIEISEAARDKINEMYTPYDNPRVTFSQVGNKWFVDTEGLYIMVLFIPDIPAGALIDDLLKNAIKLKDLMEYGHAIALAKIQDGAAERHILTLSTKADGMGYYWDGTNGSGKDPGTGNFRTCTMLITPDAYWIFRADFSKSAFGVQPEYMVNYANNVDMQTVFNIDGTNLLPEELLPDNFIEEIFKRIR
jgi:hypothetical protein